MATLRELLDEGVYAALARRATPAPETRRSRGRKGGTEPTVPSTGHGTPADRRAQREAREVRQAQVARELAQIPRALRGQRHEISRLTRSFHSASLNGGPGIALLAARDQAVGELESLRDRLTNLRGSVGRAQLAELEEELVRVYAAAQRLRSGATRTQTSTRPLPVVSAPSRPVTLQELRRRGTTFGPESDNFYVDPLNSK